MAKKSHPFRAFPNEPKSGSGSFVRYVEESGANAMLIEAVSTLFETVPKPSDPIEWLRSYFCKLAPVREDQESLDARASLKKEILDKESMLTHLRMEERRLEEKLEELQYEAKNVHTLGPKQNHDEDYKLYKDHADDPRWRICPNPFIHLTKSDILVQVVENEKPDKSKSPGISQSAFSETLIGPSATAISPRMSSPIEKDDDQKP